MSTLLHRNIVPFIGFHVDRKEFKTAWIITPYMTNGNVREYLGDHDVNIQKRLELVIACIILSSLQVSTNMSSSRLSK